MKKLLITKEYLEHEINIKRLNPTEIAKNLGCSNTCVCKYIKEYGLKIIRGKNYTEQKFNLLTIIEDYGAKALCQCECGTRKIIQKGCVISGNTKSCGCWKLKVSSEQGKNSTLIKKMIANTEYRLIIHDYWYHYKINAIDRNIEFDVTKDYLEKVFLKQNGKCALSGINITLPKTATENRKYLHTSSLDRIDSSKGYIEGNVQWVHKRLNSMKNSDSLEEFLNWCRIFVNYQDSLKLST